MRTGAAFVLAVAFTAGTAFAQEPPASVAAPLLDEKLGERVVLVSKALVRRGPDRRTPVDWIAERGTPAAASAEVVAGFRRVRLPGGATGWTEARNLEAGQAAEQAWSDPASTVAPLPPPAGAGEPWYGPRTPLGGILPRRHDGVFARATGALGRLEEGSAMNFTLAAGTAVREDVVVGLEAWWSGTIQAVPVQDAISTQPPNDVAMEAELRLLAVGPTLVLWTGAANVSLSVTPALVWLDVRMKSDTYPTIETQVGLGFRAAIAKEWWISDSSALGLAVWMSGTKNPMESTATGEVATPVDSFSTFSAGAGVTWTLN